MSSAKYRRLLLKVSGEMLAGEQGYGIQPSILETLAAEIASVVALDVQVALVIGGGNIFRGSPRAQRVWNGRPLIIWGCWRPYSTPWRFKMHWNASELLPEFNLLLKCANWRKVTYGGGPFATSKKPSGYFCRWYRKSLLLNGYGGCSPSHGNQCAGHYEGHKG